MEFLTKYQLSIEDIEQIKLYLSEDIINNLELMKDNAIKILDYLNEMGIASFKQIIINRPDICFMDLEDLKEKTSKIDINLLRFIFENEINNLMNFGI